MSHFGIKKMIYTSLLTFIKSYIFDIIKYFLFFSYIQFVLFLSRIRDNLAK